MTSQRKWRFWKLPLPTFRLPAFLSCCLAVESHLRDSCIFSKKSVTLCLLPFQTFCALHQSNGKAQLCLANTSWGPLLMRLLSFSLFFISSSVSRGCLTYVTLKSMIGFTFSDYSSCLSLPYTSILLGHMNARNMLHSSWWRDIIFRVANAATLQTSNRHISTLA